MVSFGTDGVRGRAFTELTAADVTMIGRAAAQVLGGGRWLIGRATRESGPQLTAAFAAGVGRGAVDLGVLPTPAIAFWSQRLGVPAAVITASHNPWHDNGVKIFAAGGTKLPDDVERAIEAAMHDLAAASPAGSDQEAHPGDVVDHDAYLDHVLQAVGVLAGLRVVLDCANGAMSLLAPQAFRRAGATATVIHDLPDGRNINEACGATDVRSLAEAVVRERAHLGLAFDGDGDRVIAVDEHGTVVDGDRLIALAALQLHDRGELVDDTVVVTVMSNLGFHRAMAAAGVRVLATAVGDRYVLEALDEGGFAVGGEQSGHIIYRRMATTGDGLLAGLRLARQVLDAEAPMSTMAAAVMSTYPQVLVNVHVAERHPHIARELAPDIDRAERGLAGEGRVLVRASGTEPLVRVMVEAATSDLATATAEALAQVVRDRFGPALTDTQ